MKLKTKIILGFLSVLIVTGLMAFIGWHGLSSVADRAYKVDDTQQIVRLLLESRRHEKNFIIRGEAEYAERVRKSINELKAAAGGLKARFNDPINQQYMDQILSATATYESKVFQLFDLHKNSAISSEDKAAQLKALDKDLMVAGRAVEKYCLDIRNIQLGQMKSQVSRSGFMLLGGALLAVCLGIGMAFLITRIITRPVQEAIEGLSEGSDQVDTAAGEVARSSQDLADGATAQASAIQQTEASIASLSSMTRKNVQNTDHTTVMMHEAKEIIKKADAELGMLIDAMEGINQTSVGIGKIIKTIEDIAFQTNLLALNAAVEAARAGEAGAGFSVVADEVRNLAVRAADAAKNTSAMIDESIHSVKKGASLTSSTRDAFVNHRELFIRISGLIDEIEEASKEQAEGISQISKAIGEIDVVIQRNAASAQEVAAASEELSGQAATMKGHVAQLSAVIN